MVVLDRRLNVQKNVTNADLKKSNCQFKLYAQNMSSLAKEKTFTKMRTKLNFSRSKYGKDHILFVQFVIDVFIQRLRGFFLW